MTKMVNAMNERESATRIGKYSRLGRLGVCVCSTYTCVWVHTRSSTVTLQEPFALFFEIGSLTGLAVLMSPGWLASEAQAVSCLCFPSIELTNAQPHVQLFMWMLGMEFKSSFPGSKH